MRRVFGIAALLGLSAATAFAQGTVQQLGQFTAGHLPMIYGNGKIMDAGGSPGAGQQPANNTNAGTLPTGLGVINSGLGFCDYTGYASAAYKSLCWGFDGAGGGLIDLEGTSTLNIKLNGTLYPFPGSGSGDVLGPSSVVADDIASFNGTTGKLIQDSGLHFSAVAAGRMVGYPSSTWTSDATSTTAWRYIVPDGMPAFTCASTSTQCFQEALNYRETAVTGGISLELFCPGGNAAYIQAGAAIDTKVLRQNVLLAHGCAINFANAIAGESFKINTMLDGAVFNWDGQIICNNTAPGATTYCVSLHPTTAPPFEGPAGLGVFNSFIRIGAIANADVASGAANGAALAFNAASGSISGSRIDVGEINCNGPALGAVAKNAMEFVGAAAGTGVFSNIIRVGNWHQCINGLYQNSINATNYRDNNYVVGSGYPNNPSGATGVGYYVTGNSERIYAGTVRNDEGPFKYGFEFASGSSANTIILQLTGATDATGYADAGSANNYEVTGTLIRNAESIFNYPPIIGGGLVAALPAVPSTGMIAYVTDANSAAEGVAIAGGGTNKALIWYDGTNWRVFGPPRQQKTTDLNDVVGGSCGSGAPVWTPALKFGGAAVGMAATQTGCYNAMSLIHVGQFNITLTAKGASTGNATIDGLPIAETGTLNGSCDVSYYINMGSMTTRPYGNIAAATTTINLFQAGGTGNANLDDTNFTDTTQIKGTCTWLGP